MRFRISHQFGALCDVVDRAAIEHNCVIDDKQDFFRLLLKDDRRQALARQLAQRRQKFVHDDQSEPFGRLVEQERRRGLNTSA